MVASGQRIYFSVPAYCESATKRTIRVYLRPFGFKHEYIRLTIIMIAT